jgi:quinol-cytochrome oxidoreductase complex cytochrome b subunit
VLVLPLSLAVLLVIHLTLVHQQGLADPKRPVESKGEPASTTPAKKNFLPFLPHYLLDEFIAWYIMLAVLIILASVFPAGLEEPADPLRTPEHIKPEWYFLFLYQGLKLVPRIVGVMTPLVGGVLLLLLPIIDRNPQIAPHRRPVAMTIGVITLLSVIGLTIWGWLS